MTEVQTGAIIEAGLVDWQILQQDATGFATLTLHGRWASDQPGVVEVRVVAAATGVALNRETDWQAATTAPDGKPIIFEGQDEVLNASVSGVILNEDQLAVLTEWFKRRHLVKLTDDLGRAYIIYLTGLQAGRQRSAHYHWKHTYTLEQQGRVAFNRRMAKLGLGDVGDPVPPLG